jgi:hypothetical protein
MFISSTHSRHGGFFFTWSNDETRAADPGKGRQAPGTSTPPPVLGRPPAWAFRSLRRSQEPPPLDRFLNFANDQFGSASGDSPHDRGDRQLRKAASIPDAVRPPGRGSSGGLTVGGVADSFGLSGVRLESLPNRSHRRRYRPSPHRTWLARSALGREQMVIDSLGRSRNRDGHAAPISPATPEGAIQELLEFHRASMHMHAEAAAFLDAALRFDVDTRSDPHRR